MRNWASLKAFRPFIDPVRELPPRQELLSALLIFSEAIIIYVFAGSLLATTDAPHEPLPFLLVLALLWFARMVPHLLSTIRIWDARFQIIMVGSILLSAAVVVKVGAFPGHGWLSVDWIREAGQSLILRESDASRSVWLLIGLVVLAWWRGRSRSEPSLETAYSLLRYGLIWLAGGAILTLIVGPDAFLITEYLTPALAGFVIACLISVAIARQPEFDHPAAPQNGWVWALILIVPTLVIAGFAVSATGVLTRDTLDLMITVISPVIWLIRFLLQAAILTLAVIAFVLISPLIWFLERQGFEPMESFPELDLAPGTGIEADDAGGIGLTVDDPVRYLIVGVILLLILLVLIRYMFRRRRRWSHRDDPQTSSLIDWRQSQPAWLARIRGWVSAMIGRQPDDLPAGPEWEATRRIRLVYRQFLRHQQQADCPRSPHETPVAFAHRLSEDEPDLRDELTQITEAYMWARYAGKPAPADLADATEAAWNLIYAQHKSSA